jgi:phenylalanyl-tRNA synthetase alpha subunit
MGETMNNLPPLPEGFVLESELPPLPEGFVLETGSDINGSENKESIVDKLKGAGEVVGTMATAIPATIASGYAGLRALANQDVDSAGKAVSSTQEALTYQPKTETGQRYLKNIGQTMDDLGISGAMDAKGKKLGDTVMEATGSPAAAAVSSVIPHAASEIIGLKTQGLTKSLAKDLKPGIGAVSRKIKGGPLFIKSADEIDSSISSAVNKGIKKGIRPSVMSKETSSQFSKYLKNAKTAVQEIIENKDNISFLDDSGQTVKGDIPKNLNQFSQAIEQTKRKVFETYDTLARESNDQGAFVDLNKIPKDLEPVFKSKALQKFSPETIEYARQRIDSLTQDPIMPILDAQDSVQILNQSLEAFYKDPTPANKGRAMVDAAIANGMRREMNSVIENSTGGQYKELKSKYGALKTIESDVTKRSIVDSRKNEKGLLDFSDIFTGHQIVKALATKDPAGLAAGGVAKIIKERMKVLNDPNKKIQKMFEDVERLNSEKKYIK